MAISRPVMNSSKRSVIPGRVSDARASGETSSRIVDDEGRLPELAFGRLLEQRQLQRSEPCIGDQCFADVGTDPTQFGADVADIVERLLAVLGRVRADRLDDRHPRERLRQVDVGALVLDDLAAGGACCRAQHLPR